MQYAVVFTPEAEEQLAAQYRYIAAQATPTVAERYTNAIVAYCETMHTYPHRGLRRDDIRPGLRITNYKRRTIIAFAVDDTAKLVTVFGIFYGGQNYETALKN